ncbi:peptidoglycan recognition protein family protein [Actinoalloteichus hymeniacidonis]|uniref:N-acetylmuramoyl-L-alanine amidase n=1 Tax=Actinoalloteichus hymeniacidonis TaxID=340345 RepID=A0AAC9HTI4_9PSEU|nr:peptidoglycan recognition family protein [Actinoalloteichus hymeniacidonis]AOS65110.1 N-acetylmuramoyl-L-alanine amidase [Actinoalloteichus hymeniacidonis]MBB5906811.1 hypothetical protein [Actinoalloteichus hymeniacidonis]
MLTRREMLTTALSAGAWIVAGAPGAAIAEAPGSDTDSVVGRVIRPEAFDHVGVLFPAEARIAPDGVVGSLRFEIAGELGPWQPLRPSAEAPDHRPVAATDLVRAPAGASGYQVDIAEGLGPIRPVAVLAGPPAAGAAPRLLPLPQSSLRAISRAGWGADESVRTWPATFHQVQCLTVHHSAIELEADRAASMRAIYRFHAVDQGWGDIGYHLLIDPEGLVYEGRFSGSDGTPVFDGPPSGGLARSVLAGHVGGHNAGNIGVCLLGDFTLGEPDEPAVAALVETLTSLCLLTGLNPTGTTHYVSPTDGASRTVPTISAHRDWSVTQCPGDAFFPQLSTIRTRVAAALG